VTDNCEKALPCTVGALPGMHCAWVYGPQTDHLNSSFLLHCEQPKSQDQWSHGNWYL